MNKPTDYAGKGDKVTFTVKGIPSYTINLLSSKGVTMRSVSGAKTECRFCVDGGEKDKTEQILCKYNREYEIGEVRGRQYAVGKLFRKYALLLGLALSLFAVFAYSTATIGVEISGNERVSATQIEEVVKSRLSLPSLWVTPNLSELKTEVEALPGIAYVSVERVGTTVCVKVTEELPKTEVTDTQTPIPVLAKENCTILKIVTLRGTPLVAVGDSVVAGQELVGAYLTDAEGNRIPLRAMAKIEVKAVRETALEYPDEESCRASAAEDFAREKDKFQEGLAENEILVNSWFLVKKLDKSCLLSIYYEVITSIVQ